MKKIYLLSLLCCFFGLTTTIQAQLSDVITGLDFPFGLALDGNDLYFTESAAGEIAKIDVSQQNPMRQTVVSGLEAPLAITISGDELFFFDRNPDRIVRYNINTNTSTTLVTGTQGDVTGLFIDGNDLYMSINALGQIGRVDISAATPTIEVVATGFFFPDGITKKGDNLYVAEFGNNRISQVDLTATLPTTATAFVTGLTRASGLTLNGDYLYVANSTSINRVQISAATPTAELIVDGLEGSRLVALNLLDLYIAQVGNGTLGDGKISKLMLEAPIFEDQENVCLGDMPTDLGGSSPTGGVYSGNGVTDNGDGETFTFDSDAAGMGVTIVTYSISGASATANVEVVALPTVTFTPDPTSFVLGTNNSGLMGGSPTGGVYSGPGVTDNGDGMSYSFDTNAAGLGAHEMTYTFTTEDGCSASASGMVSVGGAASALNFDGVDDVATANLAAGTLSEMSISGWVLPNNENAGSSGFDGFFGWRNDVDADFYLLQLSDTQVEARFRNSEGVAFEIIDNNLEVGVWQHYTFTYDGNAIVLYRNGEQVGMMMANGSMSGNGTFYMGMTPFSDVDEYYLDGSLDEVRIWGRTLSCIEAPQQYACEIAGNEEGLLAYYQFNQGVGEGDNTGMTEVVATTGPNATLNDFALMGESSNFITDGGVATGTSCNPVMNPSFNLSNDGEEVAPNSTVDLGDVMIGQSISVTFAIDAFETDFGGIGNSNPDFAIAVGQNDFTISFFPNTVGSASTTITIGLEDCLGISVFGFTIVANATEVMGGDCPEGDVTFTTQAEVDAYVAAYPNCEMINGNLRVGLGTSSTDINDLSGLNSLTTITGLFAVFYNDNLSSLAGLDNLTIVGEGVYLFRNNSLASFAGLDNLTTIGGKLHIFRNDALTSLNGLEGVVSVGAELRIRFNNSLINMSGLDNLASVGTWLAIQGNAALTSLSGLEGLTSINSFLAIRDNGLLGNIEGIININSTGITRLYITGNSSLTECALDNICAYLEVEGNLAQVINNAEKCFNLNELEAACDDDSMLVIADGEEPTEQAADLTKTSSPAAGIQLYPNPTSGLLQIRNIEAQHITIFNPQGQRMAQYNTPGTELDMSHLPAGVYYLTFETAEGRQTERVVKVD